MRRSALLLGILALSPGCASYVVRANYRFEQVTSPIEGPVAISGRASAEGITLVIENHGDQPAMIYWHQVQLLRPGRSVTWLLPIDQAQVDAWERVNDQPAPLIVLPGSTVTKQVHAREDWKVKRFSETRGKLVLEYVGMERVPMLPLERGVQDSNMVPASKSTFEARKGEEWKIIVPIVFGASPVQAELGFRIEEVSVSVRSGAGIDLGSMSL